MKVTSTRYCLSLIPTEQSSFASTTAAGDERPNSASEAAMVAAERNRRRLGWAESRECEQANEGSFESQPGKIRLDRSSLGGKLGGNSLN